MKHFKNILKSDCHKLKEALESIELPFNTGDVGDIDIYSRKPLT